MLSFQLKTASKNINKEVTKLEGYLSIVINMYMYANVQCELQ